MTYLAQARALGASLVVAVNSDRSVKMLGKGDDRPINTEADRAAVVAALESTDLVVVFPDKVPLEAVEKARPDIYVKGGDYRIEDLPEAKLVAAWGGRLGEDLNFRRAIQCGIDKQEVNIATSSGYATILDIDMCPMYGGYPTEGIVTVDYDPEQAREYLEASGYAGENFDILVKSGTGEETAAKVIQSQLIELGINCSVTAVDNTTYSELQYSGTFDSIIREQLSSMVDADGASTYFNTTPGYAYTKNCKYPLAETIYPLFVKGREVQGDEREPYYVEACNLITEQAYLVPLYNGLIAVAYSSGLQGVEAHCLGTYNFYHWSWA